MKRRDFLYVSALLLGTPLLANKKTTTNAWEIIETTLEHMFPNKYFSYKNNKLSFQSFIELNDNLKYMDKDDYQFLFEGAKKLYSIEKNFTKLPPYKKEKILRKLENTNQGYRWLNLLHSTSLEAMFSDPIYLGNTNGFVYKKFNHNPGIPQPTKRNLYGV